MDETLRVLIPNHILVGYSTEDIKSSLNFKRMKVKRVREMLKARGNVKACPKRNKQTPVISRNMEDRVKVNPKQSINKVDIVFINQKEKVTRDK